MLDLVEYVQGFSQRGACTCGRCIDAPENPEAEQPAGHTVDMCFFKVAATAEASAETLRLSIEGYDGVHCQCDLFDGEEHSYLEVGGWIGDQGLALQLMGLGAVLGLWDVMTPRMLPGLPEALASQMAGAGMVSMHHHAPVAA